MLDTSDINVTDSVQLSTCRSTFCGHEIMQREGVWRFVDFFVMPTTGELRGYDIVCVDDLWHFSGTGDDTSHTWEERPCGHCGIKNTPEGHDGCLGTLPGAMNACCGHGDDGDAYIQFENGCRLAGPDALELARHIQ